MRGSQHTLSLAPFDHGAKLRAFSYIGRGDVYLVDEWALIEPLLPSAKQGGRPRTTDLREVMDAILYVASSGRQWRMLPKDFPPLSTVQGYFYAWRDRGLWQVINHFLVMAARELEGREASPTAGVIPSRRMFHIQLPGNGQPECKNHRKWRSLRL
jgi:transposase